MEGLDDRSSQGDQRETEETPVVASQTEEPSNHDADDGNTAFSSLRQLNPDENETESEKDAQPDLELQEGGLHKGTSAWEMEDFSERQQKQEILADHDVNQNYENPEPPLEANLSEDEDQKEVGDFGEEPNDEPGDVLYQEDENSGKLVEIQYQDMVEDAAAPDSNNILYQNADIENREGTNPIQIAESQLPPMINIVQASQLNLRESTDLDATATVKFVLTPTGHVITVACLLSQSLEMMKYHLASELKMQSSLISLLFEGHSLPEKTLLALLGVEPNGTVQIEVQSVDPENHPLKIPRARLDYQMPDVITVRVITEDCEAKDVVVEIERSSCKKPFLGGYRNKNTGVEFHNASAQTVQKPRPPPTSERFCRDTQTCEQRNRLQQTHNNTSTQMTGVGVYVSNMQDRLLPPGEYTTAEQHWAMILEKVIILQKNFRRWLAKRYVKKLKEDKEKRLEWERQEELRKKTEKEERLQKEFARRLNPKTKADFERLLQCLEKWRKEELERINTTLTGAERKAAMCMLLDQETELLSVIERHRNEAYAGNQTSKIMNFLEKAAAPKMWQAQHDGKLTFMDTPFTIRAKALRDIYNSINMKHLTGDERLDVLLTLKHTVKEHDCKLTQEIIELIDREADLLMRGVKDSNLTGLRKRICTLFLQYIKTPTFNPEAAQYLKVPQDPHVLRKNINYCRSCGSYLPSTDFFITTNSKNAGRCRRCQRTENEGRQREDHTFYRIMLKALHKSEEDMQDGSTLCYLLQEDDLRYLVEYIWSNQSVLSAWSDPYDLVLCRWDKHKQWSPWNCILMTHDEAEAHKKLFSLEEGYGHVFIHKVTQKHNFARNYFSRLPGMAEALQKKIGSQNEKSAEERTGMAHSAPKTQKV